MWYLHLHIDEHDYHLDSSERCLSSLHSQYKQTHFCPQHWHILGHTYRRPESPQRRFHPTAWLSEGWVGAHHSQPLRRQTVSQKAFACLTNERRFGFKVLFFYLCTKCQALSSNHYPCTLTHWLPHSDKTLHGKCKLLCSQWWSCRSTAAQCEAQKEGLHTKSLKQDYIPVKK